MTISLNDIYEKIGQMNGTLSSHIGEQHRYNASITALIQQHDARIEEMEDLKKKAVGVALGAGVFSGGVFAGIGQAITKMFSP